MNNFEKFYNSIKDIAKDTTYHLDENENIIKKVKPNIFASNLWVKLILIIMFFSIILFTSGIITENIEANRMQENLLKHYQINQICFDTENWTECFIINDNIISLHIGNHNNVKTLHILEE